MLVKWVIFLFGFSALATEGQPLSPQIDNFVRARKALVAELKTFEKSSGSINKNYLVDRIRDLRYSYGQIDRLTLDPEWLYEAQFQLRFVNQKLKSILGAGEKKKLFTEKERQEIEFEAQILDEQKQDFYLSPKKSLPIEGIKGSNWPLVRWEKDPEFYNYQFEGDEVIYRGLRLRSGDVLLNHPIEKPVGIFTAIAEQRSIFAHGSMIVFRHNKWGRLPMVVDIHERGVRAVPLHHYMSSKVIGYGEVFRMQNVPRDFEHRLDRAIRVLMSEEHPYDLTGSEDRKALSCVEMISYILELIGEPKLSMTHQISTPIYKNILRFGKLAQQNFQVPNDVFQDSRFSYVGYIDNTQSLEIQLANELLLAWFREKMTNKIAKQSKDLSRLFGEIAIDQIRNKRSLFGGFLLGVTGFNRENFPVGDPGLLAAVNAIDNIFAKAMDRCLIIKSKKATLCFKAIQQSVVNGLERHDFSIHRWKSENALRDASNRELKDFDNMFE